MKYLKYMRDYFKKPKKSDKIVDTILPGRETKTYLKDTPFEIIIPFGLFQKKIKKHASQISLNLLVVTVLIALVVSLPTHALSARLYAGTCLGGWEQTQNAEGSPDTESGVSFSRENSALLHNSTAEIFCSDFTSQEIPEDSTPTSVSVNFALKVADDPIEITTNSDTGENTVKQQEEDTQIKDERDTAATEETPTSQSDSGGASEENISHNDNTASSEITDSQASTESTDASSESAGDNQEDQTRAGSDDDPASQEPGDEISLLNQLFSQYVRMAHAQEASSENTQDEQESGNSDNTQDSVTEESSSESQENISHNDNTASSEITDSQASTESTDASSESAGDNQEDQTQENDDESASQEESITPSSSTQSQAQNKGFLRVLYTTDGTTWKSLGYINQENWQDQSFVIPLGEDMSWQTIDDIQVSIQNTQLYDKRPAVYLDAMWLEVDYKKQPEKLFDDEDASQERSFSDNATEELGRGAKMHDLGSTHQCSYQEFVHTIESGSQKDITLNLTPSRSRAPYKITLGALPTGVSAIQKDQMLLLRKNEVEVTITASEQAQAGSFNIVTVYEEQNPDGSYSKNNCQFNLVVQ